MIDFDRPYAKTTSIDEPPHYLQDGKIYTLQGDEIVTSAVVLSEETQVKSEPAEPVAQAEPEQPKKRGRKPTK